MSDYETRFGAGASLRQGQSISHTKGACLLSGSGVWDHGWLRHRAIWNRGAYPIDMDEVCLSNVNRQIHALDATIGQSKALVLAERIGQIALECVVNVENIYFTEANAERLLTPDYNYIIDTIDGAKHKSLLIAQARKRGLILLLAAVRVGALTCRVKICDLACTINDPLLLQVRKR